MGIQLGLYNRESVTRWLGAYDKSKYYDLFEFLEQWAELIFVQPGLKHRENTLVFFDIVDADCDKKIRVVWTSNSKVIDMEDKLMDPNFSYKHNGSWEVTLTEYRHANSAEACPKNYYAKDGSFLPINNVRAYYYDVTVTVCRICKVLDESFTYASDVRATKPCKNALRIAENRSECFFMAEK